MEPRISIITLGVSDLNRSINFYRDGLGLPTNFKEGEGIAFFQLKGTWLALYPSDPLAEDACLPPERTCFGGMTLAYNVPTRKKLTKSSPRLWQPVHVYSSRPQILFWGGYSGYFADPDGHPWEVAWNPFYPLE